MSSIFYLKNAQFHFLKVNVTVFASAFVVFSLHNFLALVIFLSQSCKTEHF